jgi:hypothetical protein
LSRRRIAKPTLTDHAAKHAKPDRRVGAALAPGLDPIDRVILQVRAAVSDGDLRIYARIEALPESERTQSEQAVFAGCEQAYIVAFSVWTSDELRQIAEEMGAR